MLVRAKMKEIIPEMRIEGGCGPAALAFIARKRGIDVGEAELAKQMGTTSKLGTSPENMLKGTRALGFEAESYMDKTLDELQELRNKGYDVILDWMTGEEGNPRTHIEEDGHYSVMEKATKQYVVLNDSILGSLILMPRSKFEKQWYDFEGNTKIVGWALVIGGKMK